MKTYGNEGITPTFLTCALDGGEWSASNPSRVIPRESPVLIGQCVGLGRSGRCGEEKNLSPLPGIEVGPSLYQLGYPGYPRITKILKQAEVFQPLGVHPTTTVLKKL
jgi:hypothetical protein